MADRVSALETKMGSKTIEEQFREQAELFDRRFSHSLREQAEVIDRLFIYRFGEMDRRWATLDAKLARLGNSLEARLETKLETKLEPIRTDLAIVKDAVKILLDRLT